MKKIADAIVRKTSDQGFEIVTIGDADADIDIITERIMDGIYRFENFRPMTKKTGRFIMKETGHTLWDRLLANTFYTVDVVTND